jgi:hypothetical protein
VPNKYGENIQALGQMQTDDSSEAFKTGFFIVTAMCPLPEIGLAAAGVRAINLPGWSKLTVDMVHIAERHMMGGAQTAGKTLFVGLSERGVMAAIRQAYGSATTVAVQGERVLLSGVTKTGTTVEMWLNKATNLIETAYPVVP